MNNEVRGKGQRPRSLVAGGAGLIGSHLCERLVAEGHEVICLDSLLTGSRSTVVYEPLPADDPVRRRPDISKAVAVLRWQPKVSRQEGIKRVILFFQAKLEALCKC